ncbi:metallophosphoesterase family protein [Phenylobacterium sp.]|jgi:serine/threonine protein phosphatase 1|uniref:metallophosphoesterase family protein n=1 Tax=Phenylobacterium sp. TaxID=1871053 RepID=UPI0037834FAD
MSVGGDLIYAIGDIHGSYTPLRELLARISEDCAERARSRRPVLIFLGDYVDRGPASHKVLEALVWLRRRPDFEVHLLKGNHEQALLAFLEAPEAGEPWLRYGGAQTLAAYGVPAPGKEADPEAYVRARDELLDAMPASHLRLLQTLELMATAGDYVFVHAGVRPDRPLAAQKEDDLLWIRQTFLEAPGPFEKVVVHGHTWIDARPQMLEHRIGIDTGAYATGVLTALRLDDEGRAVLQAGAAADALPA